MSGWVWTRRGAARRGVEWSAQPHFASCLRGDAPCLPGARGLFYAIGLEQGRKEGKKEGEGDDDTVA